MFTEDFTERMQVRPRHVSTQLTRVTLQSLMDTCRGLDPIEPDLPVLVPGDRSLLTVLLIRLDIYLSTSEVIFYITLLS